MGIGGEGRGEKEVGKNMCTCALENGNEYILNGGNFSASVGWQYAVERARTDGNLKERREWKDQSLATIQHYGRDKYQTHILFASTYTNTHTHTEKEIHGDAMQV